MFLHVEMEFLTEVSVVQKRSLIIWHYLNEWWEPVYKNSYMRWHTLVKSQGVAQSQQPVILVLSLEGSAVRARTFSRQGSPLFNLQVCYPHTHSNTCTSKKNILSTIACYLDDFNSKPLSTLHYSTRYRPSEPPLLFYPLSASTGIPTSSQLPPRQFYNCVSRYYPFVFF